MENPDRDPEASTLALVPFERPRAVGEAEAAADGHADHVGSIAVAVRDEGHAVEGLEIPDAGRQGQVAVGDGDVLDPHLAEAIDARLHRAVEPAAWFPDDERAELPGPAGDVAVV